MDTKNLFSRRSFVTLSALGLASLTTGFVRKEKKKSADLEQTELFDCHIHCPAEDGERWQWYKVTNTFEEFVRYLDKTGV